MGLSVADVINGACSDEQKAEVYKMLRDWNERLGENVFSVPAGE